MTVTQVSKETVQLSEGRSGNSMSAIEGQNAFMAAHRNVLDQLRPLPNEVAREFLATVGVQRPWQKNSKSADEVFSNIRSIARRGPHQGTAYYFSLGQTGPADAEALYVSHRDATGFESELIVCKLTDGSFLGYNAMGSIRENLNVG